MGGFIRKKKKQIQRQFEKHFSKEQKPEIKKEEPKKEEIKLSQKGPTKAELEQEEEARLLSIKRRGRKSTKLRKAKADDLTLAKKILLG